MVDDGDVIPALRQVDHSTSFVGYGTTSVIACNKFAIYESGRHRFVAYAMSFRFVKYRPSFHTMYNYSFVGHCLQCVELLFYEKSGVFFIRGKRVDGSPRRFTFRIDTISILFWDFTYPAVNMSYIKQSIFGMHEGRRGRVESMSKRQGCLISVFWRGFYLFLFIVRGALGDEYRLPLFL